VVGIRYISDGPRSLWFDPGYDTLQASLDKVLPDTVNLIISRSRDEKRFLVLGFSDREPGIYYLVDLKGEQPSLTRLSERLAGFPAAAMVPMYPVKYPARDGLMLHGYLTVPPGREMKHLPLVVMVHGGPWSRDTYGFDPQVQFLANRGYAVMQINYRGSTGYGREFYEKGFRAVGTTVQDDIEDATRFAIRKGIADPKRIAIMGGSFGGYSTLMGLIRSPDLYCCGIDIAGVTDWAGIIKHGATLNPDSYAFSVDRIGDPQKTPRA
jgi:dipeptidyl aminopeptidase/acylaminoacyl peptidase